MNQIFFGPSAKLKQCSVCGAKRHQAYLRGYALVLQRVSGVPGLYRCHKCGAELQYSIAREYAVLGLWTLGNIVFSKKNIAFCANTLDGTVFDLGKYAQTNRFGAAFILSLVVLNALYTMFPVYVRSKAGGAANARYGVRFIAIILNILWIGYIWFITTVRLDFG